PQDHTRQMSRNNRLGNLSPQVVLIYALLLVASWLTVPGPGTPNASSAIATRAVGLANTPALQPHGPIHITGDAGFDASNGTRTGTGTAADPYIISDWLFDAALYPNSTAMIWLENTDKHVIVQNCQVIHFDTVGEHFDAFYVGKYPGEITTPTIAPPTIDLTSNVTFLNNDIDSRYGYGIQISEGSSNILVSGNQITVHPDNTSGRDWIYGINAARNTHNITIENSLAYGWPRAITVRESALNASLIHNTIRVELAGIVIGAATGRWSIDGPLTSANNVTIRQNNVSNVDTGIVIGNVSGTQIENTTF